MQRPGPTTKPKTIPFFSSEWEEWFVLVCWGQPAPARKQSEWNSRSLKGRGRANHEIHFFFSLVVGYGRCSANGSAKKRKQRRNEWMSEWWPAEQEVNWFLLSLSGPSFNWFINWMEGSGERRQSMNAAPRRKTAAASQSKIIQFIHSICDWIDDCCCGVRLLLFSSSGAANKSTTTKQSQWKHLFCWFVEFASSLWICGLWAAAPLAPTNFTSTILELFSFRVGCSLSCSWREEKVMELSSC